MLQLQLGQIETWVAQIFWPFVRIGACLMVAPIFGARFVPARVRIGLSLAIAALIAPLVPAPEVAMFSGAGVVVTFQQILIGLALGFALQLVFDALALGGQLLANSMGLSFAFNVDPLRGSSTPALGQFYTILATLTFLSLGGHLVLLEILVQGFQSMPVGTDGIGRTGLWTLALWGSHLFIGAVLIALPGMTALLIVNLAFGVVSRAAPTLNLFAVGFPVSLVFGLVILLVGLPAMQQAFVTLMTEGLNFLRALTTQSGA
jgi:flagellar biosynthesis protein FliR